jgi:hypothetical protein
LTRNPPGDWAGTSFLDAAGDTVDLTRFHEVVAELAQRLGEAGDPDTFEQRKAKALGLIADLHEGADLEQLLGGVAAHAVEQHGDPDPEHGEAPDPAPDGETDDASARVTTRRRARPQLHVHVHAAAVATHLTDPTAAPDGAPEMAAIAEVDGHGPVTLDLVEAWATRIGATIGPVVDLARADAVDPHDPPAWMAELVRQRDRHCVFPWCERDSRRCATYLVDHTGTTEIPGH